MSFAAIRLATRGASFSDRADATRLAIRFAHLLAIRDAHLFAIPDAHLLATLDAWEEAIAELSDKSAALVRKEIREAIFEATKLAIELANLLL